MIRNLKLVKMDSSISYKIPTDWTKVPKVSTRVDLLELRKKENLPDISYDLDGDGVVGGKDYCISKRFDLDCDGKLNNKEKAKAIEAINSGFEDQFVWGCDSSGINRSFRIVQKRGNVILNEEFTNMKNTYPEYPSTEAKIKTKTELDLIRKQEIKLLSKYYEKKLHKDYRIELTDPHQPTLESLSQGVRTPLIKPKNFCEYSYQENPKFKTKEEMVERKKKDLVRFN